ncbi:MAG TPA: VTT domain-containing protein [Sphingobacterium sp.]|nr:VTT domain-containing protein [Sphingobacterium sp.]
MSDLLFSFQQFLDPETILSQGGFYIVCLIVFLETGVFFAFFLPGDYLLFLAGMFCASGRIDVSIIVMFTGILLSGILGNAVGYWTGYRTGPMLFKKKDSFFFKRKYVIMAEEFFHKYGGPALIISRFVPIIRTFAPIFAGIVRLDLRKYISFNILGALIWVSTMTLSGYFLQLKFPQLDDYIEYIIIGMIAITSMPLIAAVLKKWWQEKKKK